MSIEEAIEIIKPIVNSNTPLSSTQIEAARLLIGNTNWGCSGCR